MDNENKELNVTPETEDNIAQTEKVFEETVDEAVKIADENTAEADATVEETVAQAEPENTEENGKKKKKKKKKMEELEIADIDIPDEDIWTYQVEGLAAPAINKPVKNRKLKQFIFIFFIVIAVGLSIYFSVRAVHRDTFEYKQLEDGTYEFVSFGNTGYIKEITINNKLDIVYDKNESDVTKNFTLVEDETAPVTEIHSFAFNCDNVIQTIYIGANVTNISSNSFYSCWDLRQIIVDENNPNYSSVDGVLYNKDQTEVICRPFRHSEYLRAKYGYEEWQMIEPGEEGYDEFKQKILTYVVPETVTKICELSFNYTDVIDLYLPEGLETIETMSFFKATSLKNIRTYTDINDLDGGYVSLPDTVKYIGSDAFSYDQELEYIYIPAGVTYIGHHAFWECAYKKDGNVVGLSQINVASDEESFKANVHTGDQWIAEHDHMLFKKKVPVNYSAARAEG